jgi:hypothetical protein
VKHTKATEGLCQCGCGEPAPFATTVRMYWMWRKGWDYEQLKKFGSHAGQPGTGDGV